MIFRDAAHFRQFYQNWNGRCGDHKLLDFFCKKSYKVYFCDPVMYNYLFISAMASGVAIACSLRHIFFNPDIVFRRGDARKCVIDRWQHHLYSLPFFNSYLRNFSLRFTPSFIDNEPDANEDHPWGIRPDRTLHYGRFPLFLCAPYKYHVDDPQFERTLHANVEKQYETLGYNDERLRPGVVEEEEE